MPDFVTEAMKRRELPIPGDVFSEDFAYEGGEERKRSAPTALDEVRAIHQAGMTEVDKDPDSGIESPILYREPPKRQRMVPDGMSDEMRNFLLGKKKGFLSVPSRVDNPVGEIIVDDTTREYIPPETPTIPPEFDWGKYIHENPIGDEEQSVEKRVQVHNLCNVKHAPRFKFDDVFKTRTDPEMISVSHSPPSSTEVMKQVPERSGSTTRENTPVSERVSPSQRPSQEPIKCRKRLTCPRYLDLVSDGEDEMSVDSDLQAIKDAVEKARPVLRTLRLKAIRQQSLSSPPVIAEEISACDNKDGSHVSESPQSEDDPTEINIRGRFVSVNSLMGAGPDHGCVE